MSWLAALQATLLQAAQVKQTPLQTATKHSHTCQTTGVAHERLTAACGVLQRREQLAELAATAFTATPVIFWQPRAPNTAALIEDFHLVSIHRRRRRSSARGRRDLNEGGSPTLHRPRTSDKFGPRTSPFVRTSPDGMDQRADQPPLVVSPPTSPWPPRPPTPWLPVSGAQPSGRTLPW
jgi:hypothetical protein